MSNSQLPERASLEYLKKPANFVAACAAGDTEAVRRALERDESLVRAVRPDAPHGGWTGLHAAAKAGHADLVRLLLAHGADPNAREAGDNTTALHWAAAGGHIDSVRALLDAGADVHGAGDVHLLDVIGWATVFRPRDGGTAVEPSRRDLIALLIERGARHHIFSAMSIGDVDLIRSLVEDNPEALDRRLFRFEHGQTPLHFAIGLKRYDILDVLIELGADLEAEDAEGRTALAAAMLHADEEAMRRLHRAGAKAPAPLTASLIRERMTALRGSVSKCVPMIYVPDVAKALEWYTSLGFQELVRYEAAGW